MLTIPATQATAASTPSVSPFQPRGANASSAHPAASDATVPATFR